MINGHITPSTAAAASTTTTCKVSFSGRRVSILQGMPLAPGQADQGRFSTPKEPSDSGKLGWQPGSQKTAPQCVFGDLQFLLTYPTSCAQNEYPPAMSNSAPTTATDPTPASTQAARLHRRDLVYRTKPPNMAFSTSRSNGRISARAHPKSTTTLRGPSHGRLRSRSPWLVENMVLRRALSR